MLTQVRTKLARFFEVFIEAMITAGEASPCKCAICRNGKDLKLKVIVHSGRAVFNIIAGLPQVSGTDVILAHRLLKNSVPSHEYLLMTEAAYRDLGREMGGNFVKGQETCEGFGPVTTYVQFMGEAAEHARDALYSLPSDALVARARRYWKWVVFGHSCALIAHIRQPVTKSGWLRRAGFIVWQTVTLPLRSLLGLIVVPRRLLSGGERGCKPADNRQPRARAFRTRCEYSRPVPHRLIGFSHPFRNSSPIMIQVRLVFARTISASPTRRRRGAFRCLFGRGGC